ncbi:MAG: PIN domain-containing protein, partial [Cyanobacteria bacterium J06623_5]
MIIRFLLDTNVLSEPTKPFPSNLVIDRLIENSGQLATATVAYHEFLFGYERMKPSRKKRELEAYIRQNIEGNLPFFPYCDAAAKW